MEWTQLYVVTPGFNDWPSFRILMRDLDKVCADIDRDVFVIAIDDGSTDENDVGPGHTTNFRNLRGVKIVLRFSLSRRRLKSAQCSYRSVLAPMQKNNANVCKASKLRAGFTIRPPTIVRLRRAAVDGSSRKLPFVASVSARSQKQACVSV
jgi:hypothetical protein